MSRASYSPPAPSAVRGHDIDGNPVEEIKTRPRQLALFQEAFAPGRSSTIELYDALPKYFSSGQRMESLRRKNSGKYLDTLTREFVHRDKPFTLTIHPARLNTAKGEREFYPTEREHLIEEALKKICIDPLNGIFLGGEVSVQFTLSQLRRELERTGHGMNYVSLVEGLRVCSLVKLTLATGDGQSLMDSAIFPSLVLTNRKRWEQDPATRCYLKFHPLITASIRELTFRQMNYEAFMRLERSLSRYLFKRISHIHTQADWTRPYHIRLSTVLRDSGMTVSAAPSDNAKRVERSLDELKEKDVLTCWQRKVKTGPHNRFVDVVYDLYPSPEFSGDVIDANRRVERLQAAR